MTQITRIYTDFFKFIIRENLRYLRHPRSKK